MVKRKKMFCRICKQFFDRKRTVAQMDIGNGKFVLQEAKRHTCPICRRELEERSCGV